ncbi:cholecystokinin receptor type A-like [Mytilus californianus]|uniref:cholecystokinin receptor type A-like n=1 Tax=Mytilus californianus TaxID=6549 RepID=UPI002248573B|nr:cholecystokinin receptor type A-like [Mytilus californianus]
MNINTTFSKVTLSEWNEEITNSLMPNIIILFIYLALGTCGNVFVLLVYAFQMKKPSEERYFIPILAFFDMIATIYLGVHYIFQCFYQTKFSNNILCKTLVFFVGNFNHYSVLILFIIAIQRYRKVCMSLTPSMSTTMKRTALFLVIGVAFLCALPIPFIYGTSPYHSTKYGISGMRCGRLKKGHALIKTLSSIGFGMFVFVIVTSLIIIYGKILRSVYRSLKVHKNDTSASKKEMEKTDEDESHTDIGCKDKEMISTSSITAKQSMIPETNSDFNGQRVVKSRPGSQNMESASTRQRRIHNRRITNKLTVMFFIITIVFLLCYIPKVTVLCLEGIYEDFWENLSTSQRPVVTFLYHIFIFNNIVNPIIYAFMDKEFRDNAAILLKRMFNSCVISNM